MVSFYQPGDNPMAVISDWLEDLRQEDAAKERGVPVIDPRVQSLLDSGCTLKLARIVVDSDFNQDGDLYQDGLPLPDVAEKAMLAWLIGTCCVRPHDCEELDLARKQAQYARRLWIRTDWLVANLKRDLLRLDIRRHGLAGRRRKPTHVIDGALSETLRKRAEVRWDAGANHGMAFCQAATLKARDNPGAYRRVQRILHSLAAA